MFSDGFSEGQTRNINEGFPSDTHPYTESYDYLSDSDLEDDESEEPFDDNDSDSKDPAEASKNLQPGRQDTGKVESHDASALNVVKRSDQLRLTHNADLTAVSKGWEKLQLFATLQQ